MPTPKPATGERQRARPYPYLCFYIIEFYHDPILKINPVSIAPVVISAAGAYYRVRAAGFVLEVNQTAHGNFHAVVYYPTGTVVTAGVHHYGEVGSIGSRGDGYAVVLRRDSAHELVDAVGSL